MIEENNIYLGDCLNLMKEINTGSIDMILCDLPYGTTKNKWDTIIPFDKLWEQYERIIKDNGIILLFAQAPFDKVLACSNLKLFRYEWIWEKTQATGFLNAEKMPMKAHENILLFSKEEILHEAILVFYKSLPTYNPIKTKGHKKESKKESKAKCKISTNYGKQLYTKDYSSTERYPRSVLKYATDKQTSQLHPTQKPLELIKYLINTYTNENDLILDNCLGSGTTAVGCIQTKRKYIGMEIEPIYYEISKERINQALGNVGLFAHNSINHTTSQLTTF
jgi:site-specific DNA-methyltransferase (adenine-specific)